MGLNQVNAPQLKEKKKSALDSFADYLGIGTSLAGLANAGINAYGKVAENAANKATEGAAKAAEELSKKTMEELTKAGTRAAAPNLIRP